MRYLILLIFFTVPLSVYAQHSQLSVKNPSPRVGEQIEIVMTLKKEDLETLEKKKSKTIEEFSKIQDNFYGSGSLKFSNVATEPGIKQFGPFDFKFGDITVKTDSIKLNIVPALPADKKEGLWVRVVEFRRENYLILEQRIPNQLKSEKRDDQITHEFSAGGVKFAELDQAKFELKGFDIISTNTSSNSQTIDKGNLATGTVSYKISIYKFSKTDKFSKKVELDQSMFSNFPGKIEDGRVWIE
ncbi:hypothetical protein H8S95_07295 [Pontibacter sp. KCTC 32443]|uniref:hypothetical protein n=1 Tax=Pontibacter TaxID=323449 RepID=UPI00164DF84B|nr:MULTISPECIES: hypothetical protein [Pontibacter]MBC5773863.1 hypothetical protein [Pontibacter sp. KCTC 32443]